MCRPSHDCEPSDFLLATLQRIQPARRNADLIVSFSKFQEHWIKELFADFFVRLPPLSIQFDVKFSFLTQPRMLQGFMSLFGPLIAPMPEIRCRMAGCNDLIDLSFSHNVCTSHLRTMHPCIVHGCHNLLSVHYVSGPAAVDDRCMSCRVHKAVVVRCCSWANCLDGTLQGSMRCIKHQNGRFRQPCMVESCTDYAWDERRPPGRNDHFRTHCSNHLHNIATCRIAGCKAVATLYNNVQLGTCHIHASPINAVPLLLPPPAATVVKPWACKRCTSTDRTGIKPSRLLCADCQREKREARVRHNLTPWAWTDKRKSTTFHISSRPIPLEIIDDSSSSSSSTPVSRATPSTS